MKILLATIIVIGLLSSCIKKQELRIICTTEVRGAIFPYRLDRDDHRKRSLSHLYTYIKKSRTEKDVVLLDNGDILQGQPLVYYYTYENTTDKHVCSKIMNFMKYDAATIGDHDIEAGDKAYSKVESELNFPWLGANVIDKATNAPRFKPYVIINRNNIKIAVLGLLTPDISKKTSVFNISPTKYNDMLSSARYWMNVIKKTEHPDLVVGLFHSGVKKKIQKLDGEVIIDNASEIVARKVDGFHIIFTGHDRTVINERITNDFGKKVYLISGIYGARSAAVMDVIINTSKNKKEIKLTGELVNASEFPPDEEFIKAMRPSFQKAEEYVSKPIAFLNENITTRSSLWGNSPFIDLIHKIQLDVSGADISFTAPSYYDITIKKKELMIRDLFLLYMYENKLFTLEFTGREVKKYLEYSYGLWFNQMKSAYSKLLKIEKAGDYINFKTKFYNYDSAYGIKYTVDVSKPEGDRVTIHEMLNGDKFEPDKVYRVALNSFRGNGGGGHLTKGCGFTQKEIKSRLLYESDRDIRYYIKEWMIKEKSITPPKEITWRAIPEKWVKKASQREYNLLYLK